MWQHVLPKSIFACFVQATPAEPIAYRWLRIEVDWGLCPPLPLSLLPSSSPREDMRKANTNGLSVRQLINSEFYPRINGRPSLQGGASSNGSSYFIRSKDFRLRKRRYRYEDHPSLQGYARAWLFSTSTRNPLNLQWTSLQIDSSFLSYVLTLPKRISPRVLLHHKDR